MKSPLPPVFRILCLMLATASAALAQGGYGVPLLPADIAPTSTGASGSPIQVVGQPRMTKGHPCTIWDNEDIQHYRDMLKTSPELQSQLADLKAAMDARMAQPLDVPPPQKGPDGKWLFPGQYFPAYPDTPTDDAGGRFRRRIMRNSNEISDLATVYALTGEQKYGDFCKQLLLAYSCFKEYGQPPGYTLRSASGMVTQLLEEGLLLTRYARAYDIIYNLPSWTPEQHQQVHDDLFIPIAYEMLYPAGVDANPGTGGSFASQENNRGCIGSTGVLMAGYASDDQDLINAALYGTHPTVTKPSQAGMKVFPPPKDWVAGTADNPNGGLLATGIDKCIAPDGVWIEGSPSYAFYVLGSLIDMAESMWHHGFNLYTYHNGRLKSMFDYPLLLAYPDMTLPGLNDAHRGKLGTGTAPILYEYAYRRYQDPAYIPIINTKMATVPELNGFIGGETGVWKKAAPAAPGASPTPTPSGVEMLPAPQSFKSLHLSYVGDAPPSVLYDLDPNNKGQATVQGDVNFFSVGYGILRTPGAGGVNNLLMCYGPSASHGHPDKLAIDIFAYNDVLMPTPGVYFPYNNPLDKTWFHTTLAHGTMTVDEKSQIFFGAMFTYPKGTPIAHADQLVFGPASTVGIQRAWSNTLYSGVTMDRSLFLTQNYVADLFGASSGAPHKYDLAWHIRGDVSSNLKFDPMTFPAPVADGYSVLTNVRHAATDKAWSITLTRGEHLARLIGVGSPGSEVIVGDNGRYEDATMGNRNTVDHPPTIIERRANSGPTVYGNVVDLSDRKDGYVRNVDFAGGFDDGYGLLTVSTAKGTDYCFTAYRPGTYTAGGVATDAQQALVTIDGASDVQAMYLGGGSVLRTATAMIQRSAPGLAYVEKTPSGSYIVGNPSSSAATVTVTLPALAALDAYNLDDKNQLSGPAAVSKGAGANAYSLQLKPSSKVEFAAKKVAGL